MRATFDLANIVVSQRTSRALTGNHSLGDVLVHARFDFADVVGLDPTLAAVGSRSERSAEYEVPQAVNRSSMTALEMQRPLGGVLVRTPFDYADICSISVAAAWVAHMIGS